MGTKGQKYNKYSLELKNEIIDKYYSGNYSSRYLAKEYGISYKTIDTMIYRYRHPELVKTGKKGTPIVDAPMESFYFLLKKETSYNNNITSLQEYQQLVEEWLLFYNTTRLKSKNVRIMF